MPDNNFTLLERIATATETIADAGPGGAGSGGDASAAKQDTGNASLASIDSKLPALSGGKVPVVMDESTLATSAKQDTGNTSLASLDTKTPALSGGKVPILMDQTGLATTAKQDALAALVGEVQASPTANTLLDRLKSIATGITGLLTGIVLAAGEHFVGTVGGVIATISGTFTRPADSNVYAVGDLVANNTSAGSVVPITLAVGRGNDKTGMVRRVRLKVNDSAWTTAGATIRVHFYKDSPTCTNGDNGAWSTTESTYLGAVDVTFDKAFTDPYSKGIGVPNTGSEIAFEPSVGTPNIYCLLETRTVVTPGSAKVFSVTVEVYQN